MKKYSFRDLQKVTLSAHQYSVHTFIDVRRILVKPTRNSVKLSTSVMLEWLNIKSIFLVSVGERLPFAET